MRCGTAQVGTTCGNRARGCSAHRVIEVVTIDLHRVILNQDLARRGARFLVAGDCALPGGDAFDSILVACGGGEEGYPARCARLSRRVRTKASSWLGAPVL
jgi:hypothetical protein